MTNMSEGEKLRTEHRDICGQLNIDAATEEQSWNSFQDTQKTYNLDVDQLHWLCCSLFITCRKKVTPTVGNTNSVLHGNCVSMTRLLRLCKINLNEFFKKINQWMEMTSQPEDCRNAISSLQHNFIVTMSIYQKYRDMFPSMFVAPCEEEQRRGKKSKPQPCTSGQLNKFCWKLFICAKSEYPDQNGDLVKSYNMLLCCLDLVYANVIAEGRTDLVNPAFEGLPKDFISQGVIPPEPVCIIEHIKEDNCSSVIMDMRETIWKSTIQQFCQTNVLRGNSETLMELITVANFEFNLKSLDTTYNTFILSYGEFDESIALEQKTPEGPLLVKSELPLSGTPERIPLYQQTPLNGRTRHVSNDLMISNAGEGHGSFKELLRMCPQDLSQILRERVAAMREKFVRYMHDQKWSRQAIASRWEKIQTLYYRLLEFIIRAEVKRTKVNMVKELCCEDMFNQTLLVCSAEIVTFAHNLQQNFPCILKVFDMPPFIFYRIIELVMMHHNDLLSREITKHLDIIENQCIESLCWQSNSPLWRAMENIGYRAPIPNGSVSKRKPGNASLNLFFRKYYATAALRLKHLCAHLNLSSRAMVEIWTIFEHSVVNSSKELIRDRHLDQMVMCSIYLYARIKRDTRTFADVMKAYRTLPQSYSHVYRSVFISRKSHGDEERGDIIRFYNTVYITEMQSVATQFGNEEGRSLMLSPLPKTTNRCLLQSPKKVDNRISLYLTPMDKSNELKESPNAITIQFCHSPAK
ncbi:AAEL000128-PA, partial [Aedes aegypti]